MVSAAKRNRSHDLCVPAISGCYTAVIPDRRDPGMGRISQLSAYISESGISSGSKKYFAIHRCLPSNPDWPGPVSGHTIE